MKLALTVWRNRISPLFDSAREILIADIQGKRIAAMHMELFESESAFSRAARLEDLNVDVLICGGISDFYARLIEARKIDIVPFVTGTVEKVLEGFMNGDVRP